MAKAAYLKLVGCANYNNPTIIGSTIVKGQVIRLTNPEWIAHLKGLKTVIGEDNEKFWFKDVTREDEYQDYEEKFVAAQASATATTVASDEKAPAPAATQRAPRTTKPAVAGKAKAAKSGE